MSNAAQEPRIDDPLDVVQDDPMEGLMDAEPRRWTLITVRRSFPGPEEVVVDGPALAPRECVPVIEASAYDALLAERDALKAQVQEAQVMSEAAIEAVQRTTGIASIFAGDEDRQRHIRGTLAHEMGKVAAHCVRAVAEHRDALRAELAALKEKAERGRVALSNLVARFGIAQPHMGGAYRWGGFVPGTNAGRTMEQDDTEARICASPDFLTTSATESREAAEGVE